MPWVVEFHDEFELEFLAFEPAVQDALLEAREHEEAAVRSFERRVARGFRIRPAAAGHSAGRRGQDGGSQKRFYRKLVAKADKRFSAHLDRLKAGRKEK